MTSQIVFFGRGRSSSPRPIFHVTGAMLLREYLKWSLFQPFYRIVHTTESSDYWKTSPVRNRLIRSSTTNIQVLLSFTVIFPPQVSFLTSKFSLLLLPSTLPLSSTSYWVQKWIQKLPRLQKHLAYVSVSFKKWMGRYLRRALGSGTNILLVY